MLAFCAATMMVDEVPVGSVGTTVTAPPKRELNPDALASDLPHGRSSQTKRAIVGVEPQAKDGIRQVVCSIRAQKQALLA